MKKHPEQKLKRLMLASVSSLVLLAGCDSYAEWRSQALSERMPQQIDLTRRMPLMNSQYAGMPGRQPVPVNGPVAMPQPQVAPVPQQAAPTPYDMYDEYGNAAQQAPAPRPLPPKLVTAGEPRFVSNNNMNPPATGANEKREGNFFTRLFGIGGAEPVDETTRKPIPGNPYPDTQTAMVAPVPAGPMDDMPASRAPEHTPERMVDARPSEAPAPVALDDMPKTTWDDNDLTASDRDLPPPQQPLLESMRTPPSDDMVAEAPSVVTPEPETSIPDRAQTQPAPAPVVETEETYVPVPLVMDKMPQPQGDLPLVEAMPLDPQDMYRPAPEPEPESAKPQSQLEAQPPVPQQEPQQLAAVSQPVEQAATMQEAAPAKPQERASADDEDMFMPVTDFKLEEEGSTVTVSSLADKKKEEPNWFERMFSSEASASEAPDGATPAHDAPVAQQPTWLERQLGLEGRNAQQHTGDYPEFSSVPQKPERFESVSQNSQQNMHELESMRDHAQEAKMELNSEPSGVDMVAVPEKEVEKVATSPALAQPVESMAAAKAPAVASETMPFPAASGQPELLGHISSPAELNVVTENNPPATAVALPPATPAPAVPRVLPPANVATPLVAPMGMDNTPVPAPTSEAIDEVASDVLNDPKMHELEAQHEAQAATQGKAIDEVASDVLNDPQMHELEAQHEAQAATQGKAIDEVARDVINDPQMHELEAQQEVEAATQGKTIDEIAGDVMPDSASMDNEAASALAVSDAPASSPPAPVDNVPAPPAVDQPAASEPAAQKTGALPSPELLEKVKVLPPSRYQNRRQPVPAE